MSQAWFRERYGAVYTLIVNGEYQVTSVKLVEIRHWS
jgi:hypothetical protein